MAALSPYRLGKARDLYNVFNVFNSLSWAFLVGNIIVLFSLKLGANSTYVGLLSAVLYLAFFFLPVGRMLARRFSIVKIISTAWMLRALGMLPVLLVPFFYSGDRPEIALVLILLGVTAFHISRGIGMIGNNPILSYIASGPDRGSYVTQIQIINSAVGMFAGFIIAMLLGRDPPLFIYTLIIAVGIACGVFGSILMRKIPEPDREEESKEKNIIEVFKDAIREPSIRRFIFILVLVALVSGVSRTFIIVYSREVFGQSDGMVSLYSVFGGLGVLMVGLVIKFLVDRIGAKPIFSVCVIIGLTSMIPVVLFPLSWGDNFTTLTLYLTFVFFVMNFGWLGTEGVMNTYFLGLVPSNQMMDMSMLYFFCFGIAGAGGSMLSGIFLDTVTAFSGSPILSFRILYIILICLAVLILFLMKKLVSLGALPFMGALEVMFSYRDLKAISLLDRLNRSSNSEEEEAILGALHSAPSRLAISGLLASANSPRLSTRMESIRAIDALPSLNDAAEKVLINDIINNPYTTAYRSARALGNHKVFAADALLRELALSDDYMLAGEAIIALAKLQDMAFKANVEKLVHETNNPRLVMAGAEALGIYGSLDSIPVLLNLLRAENPPPYLKDEVVLALASILEVQKKFYPLLVRYMAGGYITSNTLALDEAESAYENYLNIHGRRRNKYNVSIKILEDQAIALHRAVPNYVKNLDGREFNQWIMALPFEQVNNLVQKALAEAVLDEELVNIPSLRLLIVHWAAQELRQWTNKFKD